MSESDFVVIAFPLVFLISVGIGYVYGRLDQRGWLAEQYKIAQWQRDEAMRQRDRLAALIEEHSQTVEKICNEHK